MICPIYSHKFDTIPDEIADKSLLMYPYHNVITHLGCSLLRISVGITLINPNITPKKKKYYDIYHNYFITCFRNQIYQIPSY